MGQPRHRVMAVLLCVCTLLSAAGEYADYAYLPPMAVNPATPVFPLSAKADWPVHSIPRSAITKGEDDRPAQVGQGVTLALTSEDLFTTDVPASFAFHAVLRAEGAQALRLQVDLSSFSETDCLWLVDPETGFARGPFGPGDGGWLPTTQGEAVLLVLTSEDGVLPRLTLTQASYFFDRIFRRDEDDCTAGVACEADPQLAEVSTAVARMLITVPDGGSYLCTGALVNRPDTPELEPLFLTAEHCMEGAEAVDVEVLWDLRAEDCAGENLPETDALPRSVGVESLARDAYLDFHLMRLDDAPVGTYGRAWLGWDTRPPVLNEPVVTVQHPGGDPLKVAYGAITGADMQACLDLLCLNQTYGQTEVHWAEGITRGGASGAPLLADDGTWRALGVLSNGTLHECGRPEQNLDNFGSFGRFFPQIACHLGTAATCEAPPAHPPLACPINILFGAASPAAEELRAVRDGLVRKGGMAAKVVQGYYAVAPALAECARRSPFARHAMAVTASFALLLD